MMIAVAKKIGRATWRAASRTSDSVSGSFGFASRRRRIASVITIAPSTMMPKSIAPSESRLTEIFVWNIKMNATTIANGMVMPTISALRGLPRKRMSTMSTSPMPENTVRPTLSMVEFNQRRAVEVGQDMHIVGLEALIELRDLGVDAFQNP